MYDLKNWENNLIEDIGLKRFKHSKRVLETALKLNTTVDDDLVKTAAILHDCAKYNEDKYLKLFSDNINAETIKYKSVLHSFLGAEVAKKVYNIDNDQVLDAIRYHTTGKENMSKLEKIIYLADAIEPERSYPGVDELRDLAKKDIDQAILYSLSHNIIFLTKKLSLIHPLTISAYNYLIKEKNE